MQFLADLAFGILTGYLAITNSLATNLESILPGDTIYADTFQQEDSLSTIVSAYDVIPKILIDNAAYQKSALYDAVSQTHITKSPSEALVNIFCTYTTPNYTRTVTGTGFFIHSSGVVLTNAHVAQFLLLETLEGSTECIVRTGSPAVPTYEADLLYISPAWVQKNADLIVSAQPKGTGERDYALLYITRGLNNKPMPRYFPSLALDATLLTIDTLQTPVKAAGYPAESLFKSGNIYGNLLPKQVDTTVVELMTFSSNYADLFTISGSEIGEQGSSGGPVVNTEGQVIGLISTKGDDTLFGKGSLRAITLSYIDRTITEETGVSLAKNLSGNLPFRAKLFKDTVAPFLTQMLQWKIRDDAVKN